MNRINVMKNQMYTAPRNGKSGHLLTERGKFNLSEKTKKLPEVLFITAYPPQESEQATYSEKLCGAIHSKFRNSFKMRICALENESNLHKYPKQVKYVLNTQHCKAFRSLQNIVNLDDRIKVVILAYDPETFSDCKDDFLNLVQNLQKPIISIVQALPETPTPDVESIAATSEFLLARHGDVLTQLKDMLEESHDKAIGLKAEEDDRYFDNLSLTCSKLIEKSANGSISLRYKLPGFNLSHIKSLTDDFGIVRRGGNEERHTSIGYTLNDNARALLGVCQHYELTRDESDIELIRKYLNFIGFCQQADGTFFNYVSSKRLFSIENDNDNLDQANGNAMWALGYLTSISSIVPQGISEQASTIFETALVNIEPIHEPRAMAFIIKGLYYFNLRHHSKAIKLLIKTFADRLTQMYLRESSKEWQWFEKKLSAGNSLLPEALIYAYRETGEEMYKDVARTTFTFLQNEIFNDELEIEMKSAENWHRESGKVVTFGTNPTDIAYTVFALGNFYNMFREKMYLKKMEVAFDWFLGRNDLGLALYDPQTGSCRNGLNDSSDEPTAEADLSYLLARLSVEKNYLMDSMRESKIRRLKHENYAFRV